MLEGDAIASVASRIGTAGLIGLLVEDVVRGEVPVTSIILTVLESRVEADGLAEFFTQVEMHFSNHVIAASDRKTVGQQQKGSPGGIETRKKFEAGIVKISKDVRKPEDRRLTHVDGGVGKDDPAIRINAHAFRPDMKVRFGRVIRREDRIADAELARRGRPQAECMEKQRKMRSRKLERSHLFCLQIKEGALAGEDLLGSVKADIANEKHITGV